MSETPERHEFQTEVRQLLDLMIHSLYSHKEVFLRELISNASDALDKRRFEALTRPELAPAEELAIHLEADAAARTLTVSDNGIGMSRDEVVQNIGTIARSGTGEFLAALRERAGSGGAAGADRPVRRRLLLELHGRRPDHGPEPARRARRRPRAGSPAATATPSRRRSATHRGPA